MLHQEFNKLLQKLKYSDGYKRRFLLKEMAASIEWATKEELQRLLDFLHTTPDKDLQVKLFSILTVHLLSNNTNIHVLVKFTPIYETIDVILTKKMPRRMTVALNFLTILLQCNYIDNSYLNNSLYTHTQNLIRISGCLATMADIFLSGMMYQDTWRALCRCLAEACNNSELNQNYCTHLIPKCVKRCSERNMETFPVLQSLIQNNKRNISLFLECDAMYLFKRDLLQYEICLQLLSTIVQTSVEATILAHKQGILKDVQELLRLFGPYTQTGQWATVVLYHADSKLKVHDEDVNKNIQTNLSEYQTTETNLNAHINDDGTDTTIFRNAIKEIVQWHTKEQDMYNNIFVSNKRKTDPREEVNNLIDTKHFDQEMLQFTKRSITKEIPPKDENSGYVKQRNVGELSFSFLNNNFKAADNYAFNCLNVNENRDISRHLAQMHTKIETATVITDSFVNKLNFQEKEKTVWDLKDFKPNFVSTPKKRGTRLKSDISKGSKNISKQIRNCNKINKNTYHTSTRMPVHKTLKQRSFKTKIFDAINSSCTALVNSVTGIFRSKNVINNNDLQNSNVDKEACSYSFTEYMRKRDAAVDTATITKNIVDPNLSKEPDSCKTCNNTTVMKNKMLNDVLLKKTVKKLKVGINLYGCDFKKISMIMWPEEDYMTPAILYNLYRKIIMK